MDSIDSEIEHSVRRSTRQASNKVFSYEPSARAPLKRTKPVSEKKSLVRKVNGTKDRETDSEDEESPKKKSKAEDEESTGDHSEGNQMDVEEPIEPIEDTDKQEIDDLQKAGVKMHPPKPHSGPYVDVNFFPRVDLRKRCPPSLTVLSRDSDWLRKNKAQTQQTNNPPSKPAKQIQPQIKNHDPIPPIRSMADYKRTMELKAGSTDLPKVYHKVPNRLQPLQKFKTLQRSEKKLPAKKLLQSNQKQDRTNMKRFSCTGVGLCLLGLVLVLLLGCAALQLHGTLPSLTVTGGSPSKSVNIEEFADLFSHFQAEFPTQQSEVWKRSKIHLEKHLRTKEPTEPVSLILTAGSAAERTLNCLARAFSSSFSAALNASVLHIDGAAKRGQDSNKVKLEIDDQLRSAFEGDKPVAVIHRFEELPPDSTIIFYRYCDHESAAYKKVFLLFTVLLPEKELRGDVTMKEVEEMVQDYVKDRLLASNGKSSFDKMDLDKFGGLWSRISHLILPVVSEDTVEKKGCQGN